ncbi:MAG: extracellular solute-binding protein [Lachnospiraceae bacterium]|nr:extracellular solute-binding protein [Lachnospiraceae bacterium]
MKKFLALLLAVSLLATLLVACTDDPVEDTPVTPVAPVDPPVVVIPDDEPPVDVSQWAEWGLDNDRRFVDQRTISVLIWDRDTETDPTDNAFTDYVKEGMLREHNVVVEYQKIGRWSEVDDLTLLLAEGAAPDVCYTFNYPVIETFANQGAVHDLAPYLTGSQEVFPNLWERLTSMRLFWNRDNETGTVWSIIGMQPFNQRFVPFIREDWLAELGMALPTTLAEYEAALIAFRDNADQLLGADAAQLIPLHMTEDVGWVAGPLIESFIPNDITDRDLYIYDSGGARSFFRPGVKEAIRVLNRWYNEGLMHPDFALFGGGDDTADNMLRSGFVGAIAGHSWDQPYRDGEDGWTGRMHASQGDQANFIAVNTFQNDAGYYRKILGAAIDRNMFVPATSSEPIAALLYWDFLSRADVTKFLQTGVEGINHEVMPDGALRTLPVESGDRHAMTSGMNYDLNMPTNGLDLGDFDLTSRSRALGYAGVDPRLIEASMTVQSTDVRILGNVGTPSVAAEDGMGDTIRERGNAAFARAIVASVDDFDAVYDSEMATLLSAFAQAAIDERTELWASVHGSATMLPTD